ncbi:uncharacterized protein [Argopecten irradians]|uniref:uncharacterized protein n=1 Tax=Argopecten irradians TaxID=31199 RepID=UPI003721A2B2
MLDQLRTRVLLWALLLPVTTWLMYQLECSVEGTSFFVAPGSSGVMGVERVLDADSRDISGGSVRPLLDKTGKTTHTPNDKCEIGKRDKAQNLILDKYIDYYDTEDRDHGVQLDDEIELTDNYFEYEQGEKEIVVKEEAWMYKFDIHSAYHHIDIFPDHTKFLGFAWLFEGKNLFLRQRSPFPVQCLTFLGNIINTEEGLLSIPDYRILRAKSCFEELIKIGEQGRSVLVRKLAKCTGHIISMSLVFGSVTQLMTRSMSMQIAGTSSWNESVQLNEQSREEVKFWDRNIDVRNKCPLRFESKYHTLVYSDASSTGFGGYCVESIEGVCQGLWRECDMSRSSTWRELTAVCQVLKSLVCFLEGKRVKWFSDNQGVVSIVEKGSMKSDLQSVALIIYEACCANNIKLEMAWVPQSDNERADYLSRIDDPDDCAISPKIFSST